MGWSDERLVDTFCKRDGLCHLCAGEIRFEDYGRYSATGWQIDHVVPKARGGSDHPRNLEPAHSLCNAYKGIRPAAVVRRELMAPPAPHVGNGGAVLLGGAGGAVLGAALDSKNPTRGAVIGGLLGAFFVALATD